MPTLIYTAKDAQGNTKKGTIEALDDARAAKALAELGLTPISIQHKKALTARLRQLTGRVSGKTLAGFTRQLATMVAAGLPLTQALSTLESQSDNDTLRSILQDVVRDVEGGSPLSTSLQKHPKVFSSVYVNLVRVGEASGQLDKVLVNLATAVERSYEFRAKIRTAMIYPVMILVTMTVVFAFLFIFVVPQLAEVYESFDADLPLQTKFVLFLSDLMVHRGWILLILIGAGIYGFRMFQRSDVGKHLLARLALKMPVLGNLRKNIEVTEFTRTLGLLVQSGVPILQSLEIATESMRNVVYKEGARAATKQVERGVSIAVALNNSTAFPPMLTQMISVGEQTGKLDEVLNKLSDFLQKETDQTVENLSTALEPIILIALGAMVGFLVMSIVLPIYNLTSSF